MAIKVGEAYYEIYPKINQRAADLARATLGRQLAQEFSKSQTSIQRDSDTTTTRLIRNDNRLDANRTAGYKRQVLQNNALNRLIVKHSEGRFALAKKEEGALHRLATQFRTIGTLARGIGVGATLLSSFSLLQGALGAIIASGPIAAAALALIPVALVGIGVEAVILKGAFKGVGTAITDAFDPSKAKEFKKDLAALSPAARDFVVNLSKAKGILPNIQQTFFNSKALQDASKQLAPFFSTIKENFKQLVSANGNLFGELFGSIVDRHGADSISDFLKNIAGFLTTITPGLRNLSSGFLTFIDDVSKELGGKKLNDALTRFGVFLSTVNVPDLFATARSALSAFGRLLSSIGDILGGIIKAFGGTDALGAKFFANLGKILDTISTFVNSGDGQEFLKNLIGTLNALSGLANTVIKDALKFIADVFSGLYPQIQKVADIVGTLFDDLVPLGKPLGEILGKGIGILADILTNIEPVVKSIINFLVDHPKVLEALAAGIAAIYVALKIQAGVSAIATSLGAVRDVLKWFAGKGATTAILNMDGIALGEAAMGTAGETAAVGGLGKFAGLIGTLFGAAGLFVVAAYLIKNVNEKLGDPVWDRFFDHIGLGNNPNDSLSNSPFTRFLHRLGVELGIVTDNGEEARKKIEEFKKATTFTPDQFPSGTVPVPPKGKGPNIPGPTKEQQNNLKNITPQAFAITGQLKTLTTAFDTLDTSIKTTMTTAGLWATNVPKSFTAGFTTVGATVKTFPTVFTTPITTQYKTVEQRTNQFWINTKLSNAAGLAAEKTQFGSLPEVISEPARKTYNIVLKNTSAMWNNVNKQFTQGVKNMGSNTAQIVKSVTPGVQGLVKTYTENVKKVWDAVAGPLSLAKLAVVGFTAASVATANVVAPPSQAPVFVADGGYMRGPGGPREDKIKAWLSNGEFVTNAKATAKYRPLLDDINSGKNVDVNWTYKDGGEVLKLAGGGPAYAPKGKRSGRSYPIIEQFVRSLPGGKALSVNATTGGGHISNSYHYSGEAVDWGGSKAGMNKVAREIWQGYSKYMLELIHSPSYFAHNGIKESASQGHSTYRAVYANHFGHIHTAMTKEAAKVALSIAKGGGVPGGGGTGVGAVPITDKDTDSIRDAVAKNIPGKTVWDDMMRQSILSKLTKLQGITVDKANKLNGFIGNNINAGTGQINSWITQASQYTNIPSTWLGWLRFIIQHESGGNPRAINRTDSNAQAGHPSQGLMQTIPSTFAAYHDGAPNDIYNPVSSIVAGINYIKSRYGTIFNTPWAKGTGTFYKDGGMVGIPQSRIFDSGGVLDRGWNEVYNGTGRPEKLANVTDGNGNDVTIRILYDNEEAKRMVDVKIDSNNRKITRILNTKRG